jgi:hypothetical protein
MTNNLAHANEEKIPPKPLLPSEDRADVVVRLEPLSDEAQRRLEVVQRLEHYQGQADYSTEQARAATELEISVRSLQRLQRQYREDGVVGIKRQDRAWFNMGFARVTL